MSDAENRRRGDGRRGTDRFRAEQERSRRDGLTPPEAHAEAGNADELELVANQIDVYEDDAGDIRDRLRSVVANWRRGIVTRPAPAAIPEGLLREALQRLYDYEMGDQDHATDDELLAAMEQAAAALRASPSAPSEGVPSVRETRVLKAALRYWAENDDERIDEAYEELMDAASDLASSAYVLHSHEPPQGAGA